MDPTGTEGIRCLLHGCAWTHFPHTPQGSSAPLCLTPCSSMGQSVRHGWMNLVVGACRPVMEITPGTHSQKCVTVALFWETAI